MADSLSRGAEPAPSRCLRWLARRVGWKLMGYPLRIGFRKAPLGDQIYLLGTRLSDWGNDGR